MILLSFPTVKASAVTGVCLCFPLRLISFTLFLGRMQPQDTGVQYRRWNNNSRDEVSVNVSTAEASGCRR